MIHFSAEATRLLVWGWAVHWVCDWLGQNAWMAKHKAGPGLGRLRTHPAAFVHAGVHLAGLLLVFPVVWAVAVAGAHLLIDKRTLLTRWRRVIGQDMEGEVGLHCAFWADQAAHVLVLMVVAYLAG